MKVIHLISGGDVGGAKTHVHTLLKEISKQIDALLVCFTEGDFSHQAEELGIKVKVLDSGFFSTLAALGELITKEKYDLIHCHGSKANMFGAILKAKYKLPICTTMHSDYKLDYLGRTVKRLTYGTINSLALRRVDYHICVSDNMAKLMIERGFAAENIFLICNGVDFETKTPALSRDEFLSSYGIDPSCTVIGIAARLSPIKDIPTLIAAFSEAAQAHPELRLLIAGDGEEKEKLTALAAQSPVSDKIVFAGWLSDTDSFYNAIDINALTSLSEGFPYSIVEGARMSCATVSSDVGGISMLIKNGVTGCLFNSGDTAHLAKILKALAQSKTLRDKLGSALNEAGKKGFSLDAMRSTQLSIYETVLARAKRTQKRDGVTLCGAYGQGNSGDDSILEAVISQLRSIDKDMPLRILSRNPAETSLRCRCKSVHSFNIPGFIKAMRRSKLYISGGGTLIQDVTSLRSLVYYLMSIKFARLCGCKVLMYGCGIGPVSSKLGRWLTKKILNSSAHMATLRDPRSLEELRSMGVTIPAEVSADPALILPGAPDADVDSAFIDAGIPTGKKYIAFALRPWEGFDKKVDAFAKAADYAHERWGLECVFIPIDKKRDTDACKKVMAAMSTKAHIISDPGSPAMTIGILSRMEILVSMRLHALIFAAGQGVSLIGAVYDPKVSSFLDYVGIDQYRELENTDEAFFKAAIDDCIAKGHDPLRTKALLELEHINTDAARAFLESSRR